MASIRVRTPGEYTKLLWRRRYLILTTFVIAGAALCWAVHGLPNIYESTTMIIVVPPRVSSNSATSVNQFDVNSRLSAIQKLVTRGPELRRIIDRFGLYREMTERGAPIELVIEEMRRHILVRPQNSGAGAGAFTISFRGAEPGMARVVAAELAARFIDANSDQPSREAFTTNDQLEDLILIRQSQQSTIDSLRAQISTNEQALSAMRSREIAGQGSGARRAARPVDPQVQSMQIKIATDKKELERKQAEIVRADNQIAELRSRLRSTPPSPTAAAGIERDHDAQRKSYGDPVARRENAKYGAGAPNEFGAATFRIQDPASLPGVPVSPKRLPLYPLSLLSGLLVGLIAAIAVECRAMKTIRDSKDVSHYARLPLLVTVPKIVTERERRMRPLVNTAKVIGVLLLIAAAVPLLYQAIKVSRLLVFLTGS